MLLIGLKEITTGTGHSEDDYSSVRHQHTDIIAGSPSDTAESLAELYHAMVKKAKTSQKKLEIIEEELEYREISNSEFAIIEEECDLLRKDTKILKYDSVLIVEGIILK